MNQAVWEQLEQMTVRDALNAGFLTLGEKTRINYRDALIAKLYNEKWDGSDFFRPVKTFDIFITERMAKVLKKHKISNLKVENLDKIKVSFLALGIF
ncbi:MAG: hypothetical protein P0S95_00480 [Rhabdochlamydiaceae bacterium]|nr:hypothetical protein [Candidatus Amphrikana amoebophyrae]